MQWRMAQATPDPFTGLIIKISRREETKAGKGFSPFSRPPLGIQTQSQTLPNPTSLFSAASGATAL